MPIVLDSIITDVQFFPINPINEMSSNVKCPRCKQVVADEAEALECAHFSLWFHAKCQGISSERYKFIVELSNMETDDLDSNIHWLCNICKSHALSTIKLVENPKIKSGADATNFETHMEEA